ncbi:MAG TPA: class I SAM-dependent methyltransferase [Mycobacteriales bacterium]|nr:class I SAM-dependent methyltransferase [Mycobacteriales bacterium]
MPENSSTTDARDWDAAYSGTAPPPWDIGRPQPRFEVLARAGAFRGRILDCGCGTGEHALLVSAEGADALGIDLSERAVSQARAKAQSRGLPARFEVANALTFRAPEPFDVVLDCGVFHVFDDTDRATYVNTLRALIRPGGTLYLMCFSDREPGDWGPRRVSATELYDAFANGWRMDLAPSTMSVNPIEGRTEVQAWFAAVVRA